MKILYLSNIPSPYRVAYFNELGKQCELTVLFETDSSKERDESWKSYRFENFKGIIMPGKRMGIDTAFCPSVIKYLRKNQYDYIVVTVLASLTGLLASLWMRAFHIPYCYEGDGGIAKSTKGLRAAIKKIIIAPASLCFSTSRQFDDYCMTYGAQKYRIRRYPFTSVFQRDILEKVPETEEKRVYKRKLGITEEYMILSVGRIVHLKGYDVLLRAVASLKKPSWGLYVVGGKVTEELQKIIEEEKLTNVHFIDFILPEKLKNYYLAADFFVLPTRYDPWGLVINEAMAAGLPVVTTYACGAGTEMVQNGKNGFLYEAEDIFALKTFLQELTESYEERQSQAEEALKTAREYTLEKMAETHYRVFIEEKSVLCSGQSVQ